MQRHIAAFLLCATPLLAAWGQTPRGEVLGTAAGHTAASAAAAVQQARLVLPAGVAGERMFAGAWRDAPQQPLRRVPVVVFMHGSSGLGLKAIGEWQEWLAGLGIASVAPDSFSLPDRITYKSPMPREVYERLHAMRLHEVSLAVQAVRAAPWADASRMVLAGTSEGATAVARYTGAEFAGRMVFSWSCELNYFVERPANAMPPEQPVLNVISTTDPFFSPANPWLGNPSAKGHCGDALKDHKRATIVLIPGAPHTLINLPAVRNAAAGFLKEVLGQP